MLDIHKTYQYNFPTTIRFGAGVIQELAPYLKGQGLKRPLLVTDATVADLPFFREIMNALEKNGLKVEVYKDMHKNPVESDVLHGGDTYHQTHRDSIVGIGGGVALDVSRAIALRVNHKRDLFDYDDLIGGDQYVTEPVPHFITVPTTAGTGSEVGRSAIISEDVSKKKRILFSPKLLAKIVFADPLLTMELPPFITAATGMDALTHNMEAYLAKGFHPMCDGIALEGIKRRPWWRSPTGGPGDLAAQGWDVKGIGGPRPAPRLPRRARQPAAVGARAGRPAEAHQAHPGRRHEFRRPAATGRTASW